MKAFELKDFVLQVSPEVWGLLPFKNILKRDKSRNKEQAFKDMLFVYYYSDIKSDYMSIVNDKDRIEEIKKDIGLSSDWKFDNVIKEACDFYVIRSTTVITKLYLNTLKAVNDISNYLYKADELLDERDNNGKPVNDIAKITGAIAKVKQLMQDLKAAEKEVIKENIDLEGKMKGSRKMGLFESGELFKDL